MKITTTNQIKIFNGFGVSKESVKHTFYSFLRFSPARYFINYISANEIIKGDWVNSTKILIIPGGRDIYYKEQLDGTGNKQIQNFLLQGGALVGICAGAYYAAKDIEFAKDSLIEVSGSRELQIFKGSVIGPALCKYKYHSNIGAKAAKVVFNIKSPYKESYIFYNGGGYFSDARNMVDTEIIANYENSEAAIVMCKYGEGRAILSGVHFEYDPDLIKPSKLLNPIIYSLKQKNESRVFLFQHILSQYLLI